MDNFEEKEYWIRSSPADIYYKRTNGSEVMSSPRLDTLCDLFEQGLLNRAANLRNKLAPYVPPPRKRKAKICRHKCNIYNINLSPLYNGLLIYIYF